MKNKSLMNHPVFKKEINRIFWIMFGMISVTLILKIAQEYTRNEHYRLIAYVLITYLLVFGIWRAFKIDKLEKELKNE